MFLKTKKAKGVLKIFSSTLILLLLLGSVQFSFPFPAKADNTLTFTDTFSTTNTWVAPTEVTSAKVEVWGGGGSGGNGSSVNNASGGGGAGGAYAQKAAFGVTAGNSYTATVGAQQTTNGTAGNYSWFSVNSASGVVANGGAGGTNRTTAGNAAGGAGNSTASQGDAGKVFKGGNGATGNNAASSSGGGGGGGAGAGNSANGASATNHTGATGNNGGGNGGTGANNAVGGNGVVPGGGGAGGSRGGNTTNRAGGKGAAGEIKVTYTINEPSAGPLFRSVGARTTTTGSSMTPALPAGWAQNDILLLVITDKNNALNGYSVSGWTERAEQANTVNTELWYKVAGASESNPTVSLSSGSCSNVCTAQIAAYYNADTVTPFDLAASALGTGTSGTTLSPSNATTLTNDARLFSVVAQNGAGSLAFTANTEMGFTARMSGASYSGNSQSMALTDRPVNTAQSVDLAAYTSSATATWAYITDALKPVSTHLGDGTNGTNKTLGPTGSQTWRYIKFDVTADKVEPQTTCTQYSEFTLLSGGSPVAWPSGSTASNPGGSNNGTEVPANVIDGDVTTKLCDLSVQSSDESTLIVDTGSSVTFDGYKYATANDVPGRDPASWTVEGSADGTNWTVLDTRTGETVTDTRETYTGNYTLNGVAEADRFSLQTGGGTDTVTGMTVTLGPTNAYQNIATVDVQDTSGVSKCSATPSSNTVNLTSCGISVTTTLTEYIVKITAKAHASMPSVPGASYATTATVTSITDTNSDVGSDSASATVTVDNASPGAVTSSTATAGAGQVTLAWTNPSDSDFTTGGTVVVLRRASSAVANVPTEGTKYSVGNTIGTATVACVVSGSPPATSCVDSGLTAGTAYNYKIFTEDTHGNYNAGTVPTGSPATPTAPAITISGTTNLADASNVIKVAINGTLNANAGSISGGTWTITPTASPTTGQVVVVFVNGVADASESTAVAKYDGGGNMTGMVLNTNTLSVGSDDDQSFSLSDLDTYDCSADEDVMYSVTSSVLNVEGQGCAGSVNNSYTGETLSVLANNTLSVGSTETLTTEKIINAGSISSGGNTTYNLTGTSGVLWYNSGSFTPATSTVTVSGNGNALFNSGGLALNNLTISGSGIKTMGTALYLYGALNISNSAATFDANGYDLTVSGNLTNSGIFAAETSLTFDPDATAFISAAGITDTTQKIAINNLVVAAKTHGWWDASKAIYPFVGGTATTNKYNLKDPRDLDAAFRLTFASTWTHSTSGAKPTTDFGSYADTHLVPNTAIGSDASYHMAVYSTDNTDLGYQGTDIGVYDSTVGSEISLGTRKATDSEHAVFTPASSSIVSSTTDGSGFFVGTRTSSSSSTLYRNGAVIGSESNGQSPLPALDVYVGTVNDAGTPYSSGLRNLAFASIGDGISSSMDTDMYNDVQAFQTALGRQVGTPAAFSQDQGYHGSTVTVGGTVSNSGTFSTGDSTITVTGTVSSSGTFNASSDLDSASFLAAAGITDKTTSEAVNNLVYAAKTHGWWDKTLALYPFVGGTATTDKYNLKDPRDADAAYRLTFANSPTFASTGVTWNGTNQYADTHLVPNTTAIGQNSASFSLYSRTTASYNGGSGVAEGGITAPIFEIVPKWTDGFSYVDLNATTDDNFSPSDHSGYISLSRTSSSGTDYYVNGVNQGNTGRTSAGVPNVNILLGAMMSTSSVITKWDQGEYAFAAIGTSIDSTTTANMYNDIQAFQTALGRQVGTAASFSTTPASPTISISATGTAWNNTGNFIPGSSTIKLTDSSSSAKTFAGGGIGSLTSGLVSYWGLDESSGNAVDLGSGGNTGTPTSATQGIAGKVGGAYQFNGTSSLVDMGNPSNLDVGSTGSISFWMNTPAFPVSGEQVLLSKGTWGDDKGYSFRIDNSNHVNLELGDATGAFNVAIGSTLSTNTWYHVTATWDGTNVKTYLNGSLVSTGSQTHSPNSSAYHFLLGKSNAINGGDFYYAGSLDEVGVWSRALNSTEVSTLYNSGNGTGYGTKYNNVWLAAGSGTGSYTVSGNNTFNDFKDDGTAAHSILFTTGSTQHFTTFTVSGTAGNLITINSTDTGTHNLVKDGGGTISSDYLNIQHSVATPDTTWYAGTHSTNNQSVTTAGSGWIFTAPPTVVKIRQELNILDGESMSSTGTLSSKARVLLDTSQYSGTATYYFEAVYAGAASNTGTIKLSRAGTSTYDASVSGTTSTSNVINRVAFTPPAGQTEYTVTMVGDSSHTQTMAAARIVVIQSSGPLTSTETQIEVGNSELSKSNTTAAALTAPKYWHYDSSDWDGTVTFYAEATYDSINAATIKLQEDNGSFGSWTDKVTIVNATIHTTPTRLRSASFTPTSGRNYRLVTSESSSSSSYDIYSGKVIVDQTSGSGITKLVPQYLLVNTTLPSSFGLQGHLTKWDPAEWSGLSATYEHVLSTSNTGNIGGVVVVPVTDFAPDKSFTFSSQTTTGRDVAFSSDGTIMYLVGETENKVFEYTLSTPWDISTASYASKSFTMSQGGTTPVVVAFKSDGTKMYVSEYSNKTVYQYSLSSAWDVSTATYDSKSLLLSGQSTSNTYGTFKPDGTKFYSYDFSLAKFYQYGLSTPWDISTATYDNISFASLAAIGSTGASYNFSSDGSHIYLGRTAGNQVQIDLSTPWDLTTAFIKGFFASPGSSGNRWGVEMGNSGNSFYVVSYGGNSDIKQYNLTTTNFLISAKAMGYVEANSSQTDSGAFTMPATSQNLDVINTNVLASVIFSSAILVKVAPPPTLAVTQAAYRLFANSDTTGSALAALAATNTSAVLPASNAPFRLRILLHVGGLDLSTSGQTYKLQYAVKSGTCDVAFSGETYADVSGSTDIAFYDNPSVDNGMTLATDTGNDPTNSGDTIVNQSYVESNGFTNAQGAITKTNSGMWDFSLYEKGVSGNTSYCFRVVKSNGDLLDSYSQIPEIATAPRRSHGGSESSAGGENSNTPDAGHTGGNNGGGSGAGGESGGGGSQGNTGGNNAGGGGGDSGYLIVPRTSLMASLGSADFTYILRILLVIF